MDDPKPIDLFTPEIEELLAALARPITLCATSGEWVPARTAVKTVQHLCNVDETEAQQAICRRCTIFIPAMALTFSRAEHRHEYIRHEDFSADRKPENTHFSRNPTRRSFEEVMHFFEVLEENQEPLEDIIHYENWKTGDFKVSLYRDTAVVDLTITGLMFDPIALKQAFSGEGEALSPAGYVPARKAGGRPISPAWPNWIAELVHYIHEQGFPAGEGSQGQEAIISGVADRLAERGIDGPSRATVQPAVRAVLDRLRVPKT